MKTSIATSALLGVIASANQMRVSIPVPARAAFNLPVFLPSLTDNSTPKSVKHSTTLLLQ